MKRQYISYECEKCKTNETCTSICDKHLATVREQANIKLGINADDEKKKVLKAAWYSQGMHPKNRTNVRSS